MKDEDIKTLTSTMEKTGTLYGKAIEPDLIDLYFDLLIDFTIDEVTKGFKDHIMFGESKNFFPKPGNISDMITGKEAELKPDDIIALALAKNTPIGVLAAATIGSWDLGNGNAIYLRGRAKEFLIDLDMILNRAMHGTYTPWELQLLKKYNVDPLDPPAPGFPKPQPKPDLKLIDNKKTINKKNEDDDDDGLVY